MKHKIAHSRSCSCIKCVCNNEYEKRPSERRLAIHRMRRKKRCTKYAPLAERKIIEKLLTTEEQAEKVSSGQKNRNNDSKTMNENKNNNKWNIVIGDTNRRHRNTKPYLGQPHELEDSCSCCSCGYNNYVKKYNSKDPGHPISHVSRHSKKRKSHKMSTNRTKHMSFEAKYIRSDTSTNYLSKNNNIKLTDSWSSLKTLGANKGVGLKPVPSDYTCVRERTANKCIIISKLKKNLRKRENIRRDIYSKLSMIPIQSEDQFGIYEPSMCAKNRTESIFVGQNFTSLDGNSKATVSKFQTGFSIRSQQIIKSKLRKLQGAMPLRKPIRKSKSKVLNPCHVYQKYMEFCGSIDSDASKKKNNDRTINKSCKREKSFKEQKTIEQNKFHQNKASEMSCMSGNINQLHTADLNSKIQNKTELKSILKNNNNSNQRSIKKRENNFQSKKIIERISFFCMENNKANQGGTYSTYETEKLKSNKHVKVTPKETKKSETSFESNDMIGQKIDKPWNFSQILTKCINTLKFHKDIEKSFEHKHDKMKKSERDTKLQSEDFIPEKVTKKGKIKNTKEDTNNILVHKLKKIEEGKCFSLDGIHKIRRFEAKSYQSRKSFPMKIQGLNNSNEFVQYFHTYNVQMGQRAWERKDSDHVENNDRQNLTGYEDEPRFCVQYQWHPFECKKIIDSQDKKIKTRKLSTDSDSNSISTAAERLITSSEQTTPKTLKGRTKQNTPKTQTASEVYYEMEAERNYVERNSSRSIVRKDSKFSFDIEVYKDQWNYRQMKDHNVDKDNEYKTECDPYISLERIKERVIHTHSRTTNTSDSKKRNVATDYGRNMKYAKKIHSGTQTRYQSVGSSSVAIARPFRNRCDSTISHPGGQAMQMGSCFSSNIEFYKDQHGDGVRQINISQSKQIGEVKKNIPQQRHNHYVQNDERRKYETAGFNTIVQRCCCTSGPFKIDQNLEQKFISYRENQKRRVKARSISEIMKCLCSSSINREAIEDRGTGKPIPERSCDLSTCEDRSRDNAVILNKKCYSRNCKYLKQSSPIPTTHGTSRTQKRNKFGQILNKCSCAIKKSKSDSLDLISQKIEQTPESHKKYNISLKNKEKHDSRDAEKASKGILRHRDPYKAKLQGNKSRAIERKHKVKSENRVDLIMPYSPKKFHKHISHTKLVKSHRLKNLSLKNNLSKRCQRDCCFCGNKTTITNKVTSSTKTKDFGVRTNILDITECECPKLPDSIKNVHVTVQNTNSKPTLIKKIKAMITCKCMNSNSKQNEEQPVEPIFKMVVDSKKMCVLNTDEVNTAITQNFKLAAINGQTIHEKSCQCCICKKKRTKRYRLNRKIIPVQIGLKNKNRKAKKKCICGSPSCKKEYEKNYALKREGVAKRKFVYQMYQKIFKKKKNVMADREKKKRDKLNQKLEIKRLQRQMKSDALRKKQTRKRDRYNMKMLKKYQQLSDKMLLSESILDATKMSGSVIAGLGRTTYRFATKPKKCCEICKQAKQDPTEFFTNIKHKIADSTVPGTVTRIRHRIQSMDKVQTFMKKLEENRVAHFFIHVFDNDPKNRLTMKKKLRRRREPMDFACNLYMASLRKRPWLWVFYSCDWFYPHCLSIAAVGRQILDVGIFILAVLVWSPCILAMELCRTLMCCTACTG